LFTDVGEGVLELLGEGEGWVKHMDEGAIGVDEDDFGVSLIDFDVYFPIVGEFEGGLAD